MSGRASRTARVAACVALALAAALAGCRGDERHAVDEKLPDPFEKWKRLRGERYDAYRWAGLVVIALTVVSFVWVVGRLRPLWVCSREVDFIDYGHELEPPVGGEVSVRNGLRFDAL